ncbi:MAG: alkaline phosphatase family protein, partial [Asticcacaulis sp.]|nr:alkaline phosphatase family protein [Asticcacaulis sp.]
GPIPGALAFSQAGLTGSALTPRPAIYVSLADHVVPQCLGQWHDEELCSAMVVDGGLQQGQGSHGGFTRANTHNFMAAIGPDFKAGFVDPSPVSNADLTPTLAHILGLDLPAKGSLTGRIAAEALTNGPASVKATPNVVRSAPAANGFVTVLETQSADGRIYLDAAGMPGRVVGLKTQP